MSAICCKPPYYNPGGVIFQKIYLPISLADDGIIVPLHPTLYSLLQRDSTFPSVEKSEKLVGNDSHIALIRVAMAATSPTFPRLMQAANQPKVISKYTESRQTRKQLADIKPKYWQALHPIHPISYTSKDSMKVRSEQAAGEWKDNWSNN